MSAPASFAFTQSGAAFRLGRAEAPERGGPVRRDAETRRALRRAALASHCGDFLGVASDAIAFAADASGAPRMLVDGAPSEWRLSIAAREDFYLFGLSRRRIGVDLEIFDPAIEPAWNVLHSSERADIRGLDASSQALRFTQVWLAKEAYLKALGVGLTREPATITVIVDGDRFTLQEEGRAVPTQTARFWRFDMDEAVLLCAALVL